MLTYCWPKFSNDWSNQKLIQSCQLNTVEFLMKNEEEKKGQPSAEQMLKALEKSGYLFENEIARKAEALGFHVDSSWAFRDQEESISRELDIKAVKVVEVGESKLTKVITELLIECKSSDAPFVFLTTTKNPREEKYPGPVEYVFPLKKYNKILSENSYQEIIGFNRFNLSSAHCYYKSRKKATQFAKIVRKSSDWHANHDGVYDALILPQAKAVESRLKEVARKHTPGAWVQVWLFHNVIVLRDHLFSLDLDVPNSSPVPEGRVSFVRHEVGVRSDIRTQPQLCTSQSPGLD